MTKTGYTTRELIEFVGVASDMPPSEVLVFTLKGVTEGVVSGPPDPTHVLHEIGVIASEPAFAHVRKVVCRLVKKWEKAIREGRYREYKGHYYVVTR